MNFCTTYPKKSMLRPLRTHSRARTCTTAPEALLGLPVHPQMNSLRWVSMERIKGRKEIGSMIPAVQGLRLQLNDQHHRGCLGVNHFPAPILLTIFSSELRLSPRSLLRVSSYVLQCCCPPWRLEDRLITCTCRIVLVRCSSVQLEMPASRELLMPGDEGTVLLPSDSVGKDTILT